MSRLTARQMKAKETKRRILETALHLFGQKGFDHVTVDEIVRTSHTSKGAFYVHFTSKYHIFLEKFKEIDDFYASFIQTLPVELSSSEKLLRLTLAQMTYLKDDLGKDLMRVVYKGGLTPNPENYFANTDRTLYKIVHEFVKEGQEAGEFTTELSSSEITMLITRCMRGTLYDWFLFEENYNLVAESEKIMRAVLSGVRK
ncbi:TetR/AcrR family transcriptional regulator [Bacillus piscicola]|uniref:TetR/AcrR family transcriptional regulator n=1 Tax=Bacillus piscicola TaxID=1632684 RepID=UPI001F0996ED|nr:TetR/AcrR family transcriptional regulator [Bacillus piscicola]